MGGGAFTSFTVWGFLVGIFAVWLYAAIRPPPFWRWTGYCALRGRSSLASRLSVGLLHTVRVEPLPARLLVIGLLVGSVEVSVGTLAGAWIYREQTR